MKERPMKNALYLLILAALVVTTPAYGWAKTTDSSQVTQKKQKKKNGDTECDKRASLRNTAQLPAAAVAMLRYIKKNGKYGAFASGSLISPHTVLTCGHCVWNRKEESYNQRPMGIMPGAYSNGGRKLQLPFGSYRLDDVNQHKRTNKKFKTASKATRGNYDYGAMYMVCPFDHLQTYVPLAFQSRKKTVRLNGYPIESLPDTVDGGDQLTGTKVTKKVGRVIRYDARSTGGTGGPVFV